MAPPSRSNRPAEEEEEEDDGGGAAEDEGDVEDMEELEAEEALMMDEEDPMLDDDDDELMKKSVGSNSNGGRQSASLSGGVEFKCSACEFSTRSRVTLQRHERVTHLKKKFFRCVKCNYVTHVKARYTKHVKYHSMPMIKCDLCEFRTPYKWNLDRHLKNHMGGGMYQCSLCNFTAHIKQSLTVHIQNHHLSPDKARSARRRNKVGASDQLDPAPSAHQASNDVALAHEIDEAELLRMERMEHEDGQMSLDDLMDVELSLTKRKAPITTATFARPSDNGSPPVKKARPVPNLIPIAPPSAPPTILKIPQLSKRWEEDATESPGGSILEAVGLLAKKSQPPKRSLDQIAQKLQASTSENKSSEMTKAAGSGSISWSSRCQHCRQRCKTRADLLSHLKLCPKALEAETAQQNHQPAQQHPMENKVFVWTSQQTAEEEAADQMDEDAIMMLMMEEDKRPSSVASSDVSEASLVGVETAPGIGAITSGANSAIPSNQSENMRSSGANNSGGNSSVRRVYRCPQCSFWATTASRFHVHMVGHTNTKPFECSQCAYRSNWRWDITKHIKLKAARDPAHAQARVLLLDASGERHYDQYDRYLVMMRVTESTGGPSLTHGRFTGAEEMSRKSSSSSAAARSPSPSPAPSPDQPYNLSTSPSLHQPQRPIPLLNALQPEGDKAIHSEGKYVPSVLTNNNPRRTIWKCKRCTFKDHNREAVLQHIRQSHYHQQENHRHQSNGVGLTNGNSNPNQAPMSLTSAGLTSGGQVAIGGDSGQSLLLLPPPAPLSSSSSSALPAFRCGVCSQVSNWKHVIQRHCRLKHNGNIQVIENRVTNEDGPELSRESDPDQPGGSRKTDSQSPMGDFDLIGVNNNTNAPDSVGYVIHPDRQQFSCSTCPYICRNLADMEGHREQHKPGAGRPVRCSLCPYYVTDKQELAQHLFLHGLHDLKLDSTGHLSSLTASSLDDELGSDTAVPSSPSRFQCTSCPYSSDSKSDYVHHKNFHRPRGGPYKCPHCSYNVTRRHLLDQHIKVHGQAGTSLLADQYCSDEEQAEAEAEVEGSLVEADEDDESPASSVPVAGVEGYAHLGLDPNTLARLSDSATASLSDIPLTWVSRGGKFYKMFKCRHCPHVNVRKANIQEHEKRHQARPSSGDGVGNMHACTQCNYRCNNAGVLSAHVKVHQSVLGIVHALADPTKTDEDQLRALMGTVRAAESVDVESCSSLSSSASTGRAPQPKLDLLLGRSEDEEAEKKRVLHFCAHCPARFLVEEELLIHQRFHGLKLAHRCDVCTYTARQESHLLAHWKVHSPEYQERTKALAELHGVSEKHPRPSILAVQSRQEDEEMAMDLSSGKQPRTLFCPVCPAKFGKDSAALLRYHSTLHGSDAPYRCRFCNYAVKAQDNLTKHERLHEQEPSPHSSEPTGKTFQCPKCPSSFEKQEQFRVHCNLHGSKQKYRCDRCDYAVQYYANYIQHVKKHDEIDGHQVAAVLPEDGEPDEVVPSTISTAERQAVWLQNQLHRSPGRGQEDEPFFCQYCPFRCARQEILSVHVGHHAVNGATGSYRCNFCDFTLAEQDDDLSRHIQLHFQLKGRRTAKLPESYWKCSNLEIWSEPVDSSGGTSLKVYDEKTKRKAEESDEDEDDALYIDLSTGQPTSDHPIEN